MRHRYLLCILFTIALLMYAIPHFSLQAQGLERYFIFSWLSFAFLVLAGNLAAFLFTPKKGDYSDYNRKLAEKKHGRSY